MLTHRGLHTEQAVQVGQVRDGVTARASDTRWATADLLATEAGATNNPRLPLLPPEQAARWRVGPRTVLLVDEAAMLATDDLAALTKAVLAARAKLVLVGDPAQIGPVERAGGLLPALANRVGAIELTGIRRFTQPWEADATQQLRRGNPAVWARYAAHDRIHPAPDLDPALDAVHDRWQAATDAGRDALMMARARTDVDALNHRARAAALAVRDVRARPGPRRRARLASRGHPARPPQRPPPPPGRRARPQR